MQERQHPFFTRFCIPNAGERREHPASRPPPPASRSRGAPGSPPGSAGAFPRTHHSVPPAGESHSSAAAPSARAARHCPSRDAPRAVPGAEPLPRRGRGAPGAASPPFSHPSPHPRARLTAAGSGCLPVPGADMSIPGTRSEGCPLALSSTGGWNGRRSLPFLPGPSRDGGTRAAAGPGRGGREGTGSLWQDSAQLERERLFFQIVLFGWVGEERADFPHESHSP